MEKYELLLVLSNTGFSDLVMEAAKSAGASGGTIMHARGTSAKEIMQKYKMSITPDKELIMIVVNTKKRDEIMQAINMQAGIETKAHSIIFSLPISNIVGMKFD